MTKGKRLTARVKVGQVPGGVELTAQTQTPRGGYSSQQAVVVLRGGRSKEEFRKAREQAINELLARS